jgi:NhaP-type Na+/H+ or K+/H+ antiporter
MEPMTGVGVTVAVAIAAGVIAQTVALHLRVPGIVVLLGAGVLLGPDMAGLVNPEALGGALLTLVGFAVAVILFEGGMNLELRRLKRESRAIQQLVIVGGLVSLAGAAITAHLVLGIEPRNAILFGTLVMVTGPTVVTPLLRRFKVERTSATVLEAEGVLIDAVGAVVASATLEVVLSPTGKRIALGLFQVPLALGAGGVMGLGGGYAIARLLRMRKVVPDGLENVVALSFVLLLFQLSNALVPDSGIGAAAVAGVVVGNSKIRAQRELLQFKEQLTLMFIGMLFVLLAADVRLSEVRALGWRGVIAVLVLILIVRPLTVFIGTAGTELSVRQKVFIAAIGPRGIVAAAVAAFIAVKLEANGLQGGRELRALVFLVIMATVIAAGLAGPLLARALGLRRQSDRGFVILGANELARTLAGVLGARGEDVVCIDTNPEACDQATREGINVIFGNGLRDTVLQRAEIDTRAAAVALSPNAEVNMLFLQRAKQEGRLSSLYAAVGRQRDTTSIELIHRAGGHVLFGRAEQLDLWPVRLRRELATLWRLRMSAVSDATRKSEPDVQSAPEGIVLPLAVERGGRMWPVGDELKLRRGDELTVLVFDERETAAREWFAAIGLEIVPASSAAA